MSIFWITLSAIVLVWIGSLTAPMKQKKYRLKIEKEVLSYFTDRQIQTYKTKKQKEQIKMRLENERAARKFDRMAARGLRGCMRLLLILSKAGGKSKGWTTHGDVPVRGPRDSSNDNRKY